MTIAPTQTVPLTHMTDPRLALTRFERGVARPRTGRWYRAMAVRLRMAAAYAIHQTDHDGFDSLVSRLSDRANECAYLGGR